MHREALPMNFITVPRQFPTLKSMNGLVIPSFRCLRVFLLLLVVGLSGCVTTTTGKENTVNLDKAFNTRIQLVLSYIRQGSRDQARSNLEKARTLKPDDARLHNATAMLYQLEGEPALAEQQFKKAIKKDPNFAAAYNNFGVFLASNDRHKEALDAFQSAANSLSYDRRDVALTNLGQTALKLGLQAKAKASFEHAVRINSKSVTAMLELAELEFTERNYSQAKLYLDRANRLGKKSPKGLWLGIRLERVFGNKDKEASLALALKNLYPYSAEYLEYKRLLDDQ